MTKSSREISGHAFVWFELASDNLSASKTFYRDLFGWEMNEMGGYVMVGAKSTKELGMGMITNPRKGRVPSHWTPYVSVEDVKAMTAKAVKLGSKVLHDTHETPNGIASIILDPADTPLALWSPLSKK